MPTALPRPPRYCRQKEKGRPDRAYVKVGGKRVSLGEYGSPDSYEKFSQIVRGDTDPSPQKAPRTASTAPTVAMLMVEYLDFAIRKYGGERASEVVHTRQAFRILRQTHGDLLAREFGPRAFQQMRLAMVRAGWTRRYIRDQCQRVKRLVGWGVAEELLPRDAKHALDAVTGLSRGEFGVLEGREVTPVSDEVITTTLRHLRPTVADMVRIQRLTGMRPGEVVQLSSKYLDRTGEVWLFKPPRHKTQKSGKQRIVAIGPQAQQFLSKYLFDDRCFRYTSASFRRAVNRACDRAEIPRWSPNQLRHTAATAIREQFGLEYAQVTLGHSKARTTEIYAIANQKKAVEVALRIG